MPRHLGLSCPGGGLPTLLHKLPPAPGPLGELLCVRLLDACPLVQAVHEVAAQAVAIVYPLHRPLVVPDLADEARCEACQSLQQWDSLTLAADKQPPCQAGPLSHVKGTLHCWVMTSSPFLLLAGNSDTQVLHIRTPSVHALTCGSGMGPGQLGRGCDGGT